MTSEPCSTAPTTFAQSRSRLRRCRRALLALAVALAGLPLAAADPAGAAFPGENGLIAFDRDDDIWVMNPDGGSRHNITNSSTSDREPAWSADGSKIAFARRDDDPFSLDVVVMDADGSDLHHVIHTEGFLEDPAWSPDGTQIAYGFDYEDVYVADADGTNVRRLNEGRPLPGSTEEPAWSPDGTQIAVTHFFFGSFVSVINVDGTDPRDLADGREPAWSPDGSRIAFSRAGDIWVMNADGGGQHNLTNSPGADDRNPAWSPDGNRIAFSRDGEIWVMNADGGSQRNLGPGSYPDWQPLPPAAPVAADDTYDDVPRTETFASPHSVLDNDTGDDLTAVLVSDAARGELSLAEDGTFTYTLADPANPVPSDTFTYLACTAPDRCSDEATVTLGFEALPLATTDDAYDDVPRTETFASPHSVLDNDTGDDLSAVLVSDASLGELSLAEDGTFTYTLDDPANPVPSDTFTYQACAGPDRCSDEATVTLGFEALPLATTISASRATYGLLSVTVQAHLTIAATGTPVPGHPVAFQAGSTPLCVSHTDATGTASCTAGVGGYLAVTLQRSYQASFVGSDVYIASTTSGPA